MRTGGHPRQVSWLSRPCSLLFTRYRFRCNATSKPLQTLRKFLLLAVFACYKVPAPLKRGRQVRMVHPAARVIVRILITDPMTERRSTSVVRVAKLGRNIAKWLVLDVGLRRPECG